MSTSIFEDKNLPTRILGELFVSRAEELSGCGRHPVLRVIAAYKRIYGESNRPELDDQGFVEPATQTLISWMQKIYTAQLGTALRAGLALAAEAKMRLLLIDEKEEKKEINAALSGAAETFFASASVFQPIVAFFGMETDWPAIADALMCDAETRFSNEELSVFDFPDGDDPNDPAEGPTINELRLALGLPVDEEEAQERSALEENIPTGSVSDLADAFPGISRRLKPSNN